MPSQKLGPRGIGGGGGSWNLRFTRAPHTEQWAPKANPQRGLWVVPKANQPSLVLVVEGVELQ